MPLAQIGDLILEIIIFVN